MAIADGLLERTFVLLGLLVRVVEPGTGAALFLVFVGVVDLFAVLVGVVDLFVAEDGGTTEVDVAEDILVFVEALLVLFGDR